MISNVIKLSELEGANRIDSEYYSPEYIETDNKLLRMQTKTIKQISDSVRSFGAYSLCNYIVWQKSGIPYLKAENISNGHIDFSDTLFIDENVHKILEKSQVTEGQVLFSMSGTIGNAAVAHNIPLYLNSNQDIAKITLRKGYSPYYVAAFLNSRYGQLLTKRQLVGSVQQHIFLWQIKNLRIPIVAKGIERKVEIMSKKGLDALEFSKSLYSKAEKLLLEKLDLRMFEPRYQLAYKANLSDVFSTHRADAEYFNPIYDKLISKLATKFELTSLGKLLFDFRKGVEVGRSNYEERGKRFIRVSNLSISGIVNRDQKYVNESIYKKLRENYGPTKGDFLLTKDATPGIAYVVKESIEGIISSGILRLKIDEREIKKEYLALCVNSIIGRLQVERDAGGSVIKHWRPEKIKELLIPMLPEKDQQQIVLLVKQSFEANKQGTHLLQEAIRKVEEAIEKV